MVEPCRIVATKSRPLGTSSSGARRRRGRGAGTASGPGGPVAGDARATPRPGRAQVDLVGLSGEVEQVLAQRLGAAEVEEGQGERGVGPSR